MTKIWLIVLLWCGAVTLSAQPGMPVANVFIMAYTKNNTPDGLHLAYSRDGYNWKTLHDDSSFLKPSLGPTPFMQHPFIYKDQSGLFHLVYTLSETGSAIGYTSSPDLINWSSQKKIPVMAQTEGTLNCWAPEITWSSEENEYLVYWASTVNGKPAESNKPKTTLNHRIYGCTTKNFKKFGKSRLLYDPGFSVNHASIFPYGTHYVLLMTMETKNPDQKTIRLTTAPKLLGPYFPPSGPLTTLSPIENPACIQVEENYVLYYYNSSTGKNGAISSFNIKTWEDVSGRVSMPNGISVGSIFAISNKQFVKLAGGK
jgi:hypothetical protein